MVPYIQPGCHELRFFPNLRAVFLVLSVVLVADPPGRKKNKDLDLRLFARRHAFAGYTRLDRLPEEEALETCHGCSGSGGGGGGGSVATRHHCIDWNYVGEPRPRPNKWRVEMGPGGDVWKEWGFAKVIV